MKDINEIRNSFEQELIDNGYRFYKDTLSNGLRIIQKRFWDERGVKYFITIRHFNYSEQGIPLANSTDRYIFTTQFSLDKKGKYQTLNFEYSADFLLNEWRPVTTLQEAEAFFEKLFHSTGADYYELYYSDEEE